MKLLEYLAMGLICVKIVVIGVGASVIASALTNEWLGVHGSVVLWGLAWAALLGYDIYRIDKRGGDDE